MKTLAFLFQWLLGAAAAIPIAVLILWLLEVIKVEVFIR
jgi:hypothetical protein